MRSLAQSNGKRSRTRAIVVLAILAEESWTLGCGPGCASPPPPPPPAIEVSVKPVNGSIVLGGQATFTATVTITTDTTVSWGVNGVAGGKPALGTITTAEQEHRC